MNVDLCRLNGLVPQPEGDHRLIDSMLEQLHCRAVPQDMRADALGGQRWAPYCRGEHVPPDKVLERVAAQPVPTHRREQRLIGVTAPLLEPLFEQLGGVAAKRGAALLAAFAVAPDM